MSLVLDASTALAWVLGEAQTAVSTRARQVILTASVHAPSIWPLEMASVLLTQARRGRIGLEDCVAGLRQVAGLPVELDPADAALACGAVAALAQQHGLTAYDAAYVELALRLQLPLATLDGRLARAAKAAGAQVL